MAASNIVDFSQFISAPQLKKFHLSEVEPTGKKLDIGRYGEVEELKMRGRRVTGKYVLLNSGRGNVQTMLQDFTSVCELLHKLRHPNIIHFIGLCFLPDSLHQKESLQPVMVVEHIENDLYRLLDTQANIQLSKKVSILLDVSKGLAYLHDAQNSIVHGDLTSSNILLNERLQAKISNLGNAQRIKSPWSRVRSHFTSVPGTLVYMPPEASGPKPQCSTETDIFSFGVIMLHTITQVFPGDLPAPKYTDHGSKKSKVRTRTEIERRAPYLEIAYGQLGENHALSMLMCKCLENLPKDRPTAVNIESQLEGVGATFVNQVEMTSEVTTEQVILRRGVRFDGTAEKRTEAEKAELKIKHQSMSFMHTHVLVSHTKANQH